MRIHIGPRAIAIVLLWGVLCSCFFTVTTNAQNFSNGFNFYLPPIVTGSTRFIPQFPRVPLTDQDFVSLNQDGHFSMRTKLIRFFGVNLYSTGNFPPKSKAWFVAGRLCKMGFNLVRFHQIDNNGDDPVYHPPQSLFQKGSTIRKLYPAALST